MTQISLTNLSCKFSTIVCDRRFICTQAINIYSLIGLLSTALLPPGLAAVKGSKGLTAAQRRRELPLSKDRAMK